MAESLRSKFQEHLSCAICLEKLKDPKVLPCLHSYCHNCIARLDMTDNVLTCPECRTTVEVCILLMTTLWISFTGFQ